MREGGGEGVRDDWSRKALLFIQGSAVLLLTNIPGLRYGCREMWTVFGHSWHCVCVWVLVFLQRSIRPLGRHTCLCLASPAFARQSSGGSTCLSRNVWAGLAILNKLCLYVHQCVCVCVCVCVRFMYMYMYMYNM